MNTTFSERFRRHLRIIRKNRNPESADLPILILYINSICNLTCEHCLYWRNLNRKDDLSFEEIKALSEELGRIDNLNLSGGEPFLRPDFGEICRLFVRNNGVEKIYVPTNGYFTDKTIQQLRILLQEPSLKMFVCEISLDGTQEYHNRFRGSNKSFQKAMETYDELAKLRAEDPRLEIHGISTATSENIQEIEELTKYLLKRCPEMSHHSIGLIRGDRKNPSLLAPDLRHFQELVRTADHLWKERDASRFGGSVEPMVHWAKVQTVEKGRQIVPCRAGVLIGVVKSNGDVAFCENHTPVGNLREGGFLRLWRSEQARRLRQSVANKECHCTNEVFLWPSIVFQPTHLARAFVQSKRFFQSRQD